MLTSVILTFALLAVFAASVMIYRLEAERGMPPFILYVGAYYFVFFGILSWFAAAFVPHLPYDGSTSARAALFIFAFVALQVAAYALVLRIVRPRAEAAKEVAAGPLALVAWGGITLVFLFYTFDVLQTLPSIPQLKQPLWYFAISILTLLSLQRQISWQHSAALVLAVILKLGLDLSNGEIHHSVFSLVIILNTALLSRRYVLFAACVISTFVIILSYGPIKYYARSIVRSEPTNVTGFEAGITLGSISPSIKSMARRSSAALLTNHAIANTPDAIPFDSRSPLTDALINHIPRVLWSDKPRENLGGVFGRKYGILNPDDYRSSWNICWPVDFYITGGFAWALAHIFFIGTLFGLAIVLLSRLSDRTFSFGIFSATIFPLFYQESNFSVMSGSVFWSAGFLFASYWISRRFFALLKGGARWGEFRRRR